MVGGLDLNLGVLNGLPGAAYLESTYNSLTNKHRKKKDQAVHHKRFPENPTVFATQRKMPLLLQFKQWERELEIGHRETTHRM
jgi:hypothetical protein